MSEGMMILAQRHYRQGKYAESEKLYEEIYAQNSHLRDIERELGHTKIALGKLQDGIQLLRVARDRDPDDIAIQIELTLAYVTVGDIETAKHYLQQILALETKYTPDAYFELARIHLGIEDYGLAQDMLETIANHPRFAIPARIELAQLFMKTTQYVAALETLKEISTDGQHSEKVRSLQKECEELIRKELGLMDASLTGATPDHPLTIVRPINTKPF